MKDICCHNCTHLIKMEPDKNRLFPDRWGCNLHKLYNGEVRENKLKELGI